MNTRFALLLFFCICFTRNRAYGQTITIDDNVIGRTFDGIGALSAGASSRLLIDYPEQYRSQILDYLLKPNFGASLSELKVEIGGDVNSTAGTESSYQHERDILSPNQGYEWWLMDEAKKRNPHIYLDALEWGAPYWVGNGNFYSEDNAKYIANFVKIARDIHGLNINYVGIWNETLYNTAWIKKLNQQLKRLSLTTKIVAADEVRAWTIADRMKEDPQLNDAIDILGVHYPRGQGEGLTDTDMKIDPGASKNLYVTRTALTIGKPLWASEDGPWRGDWIGAKALIKTYIRNYIDVKITKTIIWSLITSYYDNVAISGSGLMKANQPWNGHYEVQPAIWATAHFNQFVQPGWIYLEGQGNGYLDKKGSYVTLISPDRQNMSMIIETVDAKVEQKFKVNIKNPEYGSKVFHIWRSDSLQQFIKLKDERAVNGILAINLTAGSIYSITTTTGQKKGDFNSAIPSAGQFPIPYKDSFNTYKINSLPKYTSDISGVFEIQYNGKQRYLEQIVEKKGIEWPSSLNAQPFTIIGDTSLKDYKIKIDIKLEKKGQSGFVMGRIPKVIQNDVLPPPGYWLEVNTNGHFRFCVTGKPIAAGWYNWKDSWFQKNGYFKNDTSNSAVFDAKGFSSMPDSLKRQFGDLKRLTNQQRTSSIVLLAVFKDGTYSIYKEKILARGGINFPMNRWNDVSLAFDGNNIVGDVNHIRIFSVIDDSFQNGYAGWGCGWHKASFDNMSITRD